MNPLVSIRQLDFAYGESLVLQQVDLDVLPGTTVGLIGPNGGGKTTLVRLLLGLLKPTRGTVRVGGITPAAAVRRGDLVGYLPQNPRLPDGFPISVRQMVRLGLVGKTGMLRGYRADDVAFADGLLERVGIAAWADVPAASLSGGQLQRALIARALAPRPKLLVLDEPTTGIDRLGQQQFMEQIVALKQELGLTIVLVSHDLRAVSAISDRIACLNLTMHYHDVPEHLPPDLVYQMFACDLEAMGIGVAGHQCTHGHDPAADAGRAAALAPFGGVTRE